MRNHYDTFKFNQRAGNRPTSETKTMNDKEFHERQRMRFELKKRGLVYKGTKAIAAERMGKVNSSNAIGAGIVGLTILILVFLFGGWE